MTFHEEKGYEHRRTGSDGLEPEKYMMNKIQYEKQNFNKIMVDVNAVRDLLGTTVEKKKEVIKKQGNSPKELANSFEKIDSSIPLNSKPARTNMSSYQTYFPKTKKSMIASLPILNFNPDKQYLLTEGDELNSQE